MLRAPGDEFDTHNALPQPIKTDANGEFVIPGLPQGATISLDVKGPGYAKESHHNVPVSAKRLEFQLKREGRIEGRRHLMQRPASAGHEVGQWFGFRASPALNQGMG